MDSKVLCPTLSIMLQKTIVALCEVNIKYNNKLEISGSLHIRSDGHKVLTCLIDEESIKGQGQSQEAVARGILVEPFQKQQRNVNDALSLAADALSSMNCREVEDKSSENQLPQISDAENLMALATASQSIAAAMQNDPIQQCDSIDISSASSEQSSDALLVEDTMGQMSSMGGDQMIMTDSQHQSMTQSSGVMNIPARKNLQTVEYPPNFQLNSGQNMLTSEAQKALENEGEKPDNYREILEQVISHAMNKLQRHDLHSTVGGGGSSGGGSSGGGGGGGFGGDVVQNQSDQRKLGYVQPMQHVEPLSHVPRSCTSTAVNTATTTDPRYGTVVTTAPAVKVEPPELEKAGPSNETLEQDPSQINSPPFGRGGGFGGGRGGGRGGRIPPFAAAFHRQMRQNLMQVHIGSPPDNVSKTMEGHVEDACTYGKVGKKKWQCVLCGLMLSSKFYLKSHINAVHTRSRIFPCEICGKLFYSHGAQRIHKLRNHWVEKRHKCQFCGQLFVLPFELRQHIQKKHENQTAHT